MEVVQWAHAVNSRRQLTQALDAGIQHIEADVLLDAAGKPILAHPPDRTSDIGVRELFETLVKYSQHEGNSAQLKEQEAVLKLDFKEPAVVQQCLDIADEFRRHLADWELWLNADILRGPGGGTPVFDADAFVTQCKEHGTLSLGWTTSKYTLQFDYTSAMAHEMIELCNAHSLPTPPTFAMSACYARESPSTVAALLSRVSRSSITLWGLVDPPIETWARGLYRRHPGRVHIDCLPAGTVRCVAYTLMRLMRLMRPEGATEYEQRVAGEANEADARGGTR